MAEFGTRAITDAGWATSRTFVYVDDWDTARVLEPQVPRSSRTG
jgi:hypothetical protein